MKLMNPTFAGHENSERPSRPGLNLGPNKPVSGRTPVVTNFVLMPLLLVLVKLRLKS
jgi:hypothetical protein